MDGWMSSLTVKNIIIMTLVRQQSTKQPTTLVLAAAFLLLIVGTGTLQYGNDKSRLDYDEPVDHVQELQFLGCECRQESVEQRFRPRFSNDDGREISPTTHVIVSLAQFTFPRLSQSPTPILLFVLKR